jgi:hypothetical protein
MMNGNSYERTLEGNFESQKSMMRRNDDESYFRGSMENSPGGGGSFQRDTSRNARKNFE